MTVNIAHHMLLHTQVIRQNLHSCLTSGSGSNIIVIENHSYYEVNVIRRNTKQRTLVLNAVRSLCRHVTADEVYSYLRTENPAIGKGTVYRNLKILAEEGQIRHIEIPYGPDRFDFTITEHQHARCIICGNLYDVEINAGLDPSSLITDTHGIRILGYDIIFKGICPNCTLNERNEKNG